MGIIRETFMSPDRDPDSIDSSLIEEHLRAVTEDGRVSCADAQAVAMSLQVPMLEVGRVADRLHIRISQCQLGCF